MWIIRYVQNAAFHTTQRMLLNKTNLFYVYFYSIWQIYLKSCYNEEKGMVWNFAGMVELCRTEKRYLTSLSKTSIMQNAKSLDGRSGEQELH